MRRLTAVVLVLAAGPAHAAPTDPLAFFEAEVRPVLADACLRCHGEKKQEGGLRLDSRSAAVRGGDSGPALVPGKPDASRLLQAVTGAGDRRMPPSGPRLAPEKVAALRRWVELGAPWTGEDAPKVAGTRSGPPTVAERQHWSFRPVTRPEVPAVRDTAWPLTPVDRFILARLEKEGLKPSLEADRRTLARRLTFDLTGLPPTPEEVEAFVKDDRPDAYDRLVEGLLASPAYGEKWGRHWLDVVRYADTAGDGADYPVREAYRYRNHVLRAFNADQPFDVFLREQIAGDILARAEDAAGRQTPEQYADRVTATGFLAVAKRYGYADNAAFQHLDFADVIDGLGQSVLGLSLGCARCHDHKYDPITSADYYALYGILQSSRFTFPGGEELKRPAHRVPLVPPAEAVRRDRLRAETLATLNADLARLARERLTVAESLHPGGAPDLAFEGQPAGKLPGTPWFAAGPNEVSAEAQSPLEHAHLAGRLGFRMRSGQLTDGLRYTWPAAYTAEAVPVLHFNLDLRISDTRDRPGGYRGYLGRGVIGSPALEFAVTADGLALKDAKGFTKVRGLEPGTWYALRLTIDLARKTVSGRVGRPGDDVEIAARSLAAGWDGRIDTFIVDGAGGNGPRPTLDLDNLALRGTPFPALGEKVAAPAADKVTAARETLAALDGRSAELRRRQAAEVAKDPYPLAYGVAEGTPTDAKVQLRGEPDRLGVEVPRRFLELLGGDPLPDPKAGSGRRELAEWLTRPENPLTARVFVNRVWGWHFGQGIVPTPSDFGLRGDPPSHPELLDWLASEFVRGGWKVKDLHRLIVRSRVYRQSSADQPAARVRDPRNRLLWQFSRRRLDAEEIRDGMLAVGGTLDRTEGGAHPFPPVETWGFTIHHPFHAVYETDRRSVYLMLQRNRRHPFLALFDAADPNLSTAERRPTTTPLQALYLMNDPFVHARAADLARRVLADAADDPARAAWAHALALGRPATPAETARAAEFVARYRAKLNGPEADAKAWAAYARVLLTSNAFLFVD